MHLKMESLVFEFMDQCKFIFFPKQWNPFFLDCSKNEIFVLLLVYRKNCVNMTEIAEHLRIPLNTVTGVVNRLEKKEIILRERSKEDKRIVTIVLTDKGKIFLKKEMKELERYFSKVMNSLTEQEKETLSNVVGKVFRILQEEKPKVEKKVKRIMIE